MNSMGDIATIEPVQVPLTLFEEQGDPLPKFASSWSFNSDSTAEAMEKEKDTDDLLNEIATYKTQLEASDSDQMQLFHRLEHYENSVEQLTSQLQNSESEREFYILQHQEATLRLNDLEQKTKELSEQASEAGKLREQLSNVLRELKSTQVEMLSVQAEHAALKDDKHKALAKAEAMESITNSERRRAEDLLKQLADTQVEMALLKSELIKTRSKLAATEAAEIRAKKHEKGKSKLVSRRPVLEQHNGIEEGNEGSSGSSSSSSGSSSSSSGGDHNSQGGVGRGKIMIPLVDYEALVERASSSNQNLWKDYNQSASELKVEMVSLKEELEGAMSRIGELRAIAEEAVARADAAERGKDEVEEELRKLKEKKQKRKAALLALREESLSGKFNGLVTSSYAKSAESFQPLGKILNLTY